MSALIIINNDTRLFFIKGELRVGSLAAVEKLYAATLDDLVIITTLSQPTSTADCIKRCIALFESMGVQAQANAIEKRVAAFKAAGIVHQAAAPTSAPSAQPLPLKKPNNTVAAIPDADDYRVCKNFMLRPAAGGFDLWHSGSQSYQRLSVLESIVAASFSTGKTVERVLSALINKERSRSQLTSVIESLIANDLLQRVSKVETKSVAKPAAKPAPAPPPQPAQSLQDLEALVKARIESAAKDKAKIPIYFVPHTSNHYPLALGMMYSSIKAYKGGMLLKHYHLVPITYLTPNALMNGPYKTYGPGIWFFSNYMWSEVINREISQVIKGNASQNIMIHGGPSTPNYEAACQQFMRDNPSVDIAVHGEGELTVVDILTSLLENPADLRGVNGITYRSKLVAGEEFIRTPARERAKDLDAFPSPYLDGVFDNYGSQIYAAIIESNRGCPFGCTFCDWGSATNQKIRKFDLDRVKQEILWIAKNQVRVLWIADANFGIYDRDIELAKWICEVKDQYGYPTEVVVNYTKNATARLAEIIEVFADNGICSQGIISIQSRDEETLKVINRKNIKTDKYNDLANIFQEKGLPLSTDLMIGLPGSTVDRFADDLQYYFDKDVTVKAYPTQLLPNSPMADPGYMEKYQIKTDADSMLISTFSYTEADLATMKDLFMMFNIAESLSTLRYVLRYLQWDHGVKALDFIRRLNTILSQSPADYPVTNFVMRYFVANNFSLPGGWGPFYQEIARFIEKQFSIPAHDELAAILKFNERVMPDDTQRYPLEVDVDFDIVAYFNQRLLNDDGKPLKHFSSNRILVEDPFSFARINYSERQYDTHQIFWELENPLRRHQSAPNFVG